MSTKKRKEMVVRDGKLVELDRRTWLPPDNRRIGRGLEEDAPDKWEGNVYFLPDGRYQLVSDDIVHFLTIPEERVFTTKEQETYFLLFHHREWYMVWDGIIYRAKWAP